MSSIRRILSGISSAAAWATRLEVTAPIRHQPTAPVEPVRRGFSDHSDFQSAQEAESSLLATHAPNLAGQPRKSFDPMGAYTGRSDFQARPARYHHLLGTNIPAPPARYWETWRSRSAPTLAAPQEPQAAVSSQSSRTPSLAATTDLEKSFELAGEDDSVLLYTPKDKAGEGGRSVVQHADGSITDPAAPENRLANAQEWESAHPELQRAVSLSRDDLELVLDMPEGRSRDEVLSELANTDPLEGADSAHGDGFMPSLDDLPVEADAASDPETAYNDFMPSLEDLPGSHEPAASLHTAPPGSEPLSPEELEAQLSPSGELAEGRTPLQVAEQAAQRGTPELQAQVATLLYEKSQTPGFAEAPAYTRGAALAASGSPQAAHALLQRVGEANLADFVRSVMQA